MLRLRFGTNSKLGTLWQSFFGYRPHTVEVDHLAPHMKRDIGWNNGTLSREADPRIRVHLRDVIIRL